MEQGAELLCRQCFAPLGAELSEVVEVFANNHIVKIKMANGECILCLDSWLLLEGPDGIYQVNGGGQDIWDVYDFEEINTPGTE